MSVSGFQIAAMCFWNNCWLTPQKLLLFPCSLLHYSTTCVQFNPHFGWLRSTILLVKVKSLMFVGCYMLLYCRHNISQVEIELLISPFLALILMPRESQIFYFFCINHPLYMIGVPMLMFSEHFPLFFYHFDGPNMARCRLRSLFRRKRLPLRRLRRCFSRLRRLLRHRPAAQPAGLGRQVPFSWAKSEERFQSLSWKISENSQDFSNPDHDWIILNNWFHCRHGQKISWLRLRYLQQDHVLIGHSYPE